MNGIKQEDQGYSSQQQQPIQLQQIPKRPMGQNYCGMQGGGKIVAGPAEKKMVAEYARIHGAVAAARKFGVPPPVSTYYQRKDSGNREYTILSFELGNV